MTLRPHKDPMRGPDVREGIPRSFALWMVLLLAALLALLVWAAVKDLTVPSPGPMTLVQAESDRDRVVLTETGGEPLRLDRGHVVVHVDGDEHWLPLTRFASSTSDGTTWRTGESLCVVGPPPCAVAGGTEVEVALVVDGHTLAHSRSVLDG